MPLAPGDFLPHLDRDAARFSALLSDSDLAAAVPACPGWDLAALAGHLGGIHRWARDAVVLGRATDEERPYPADGASLRAWFDEGAADLLATLRATDPQAPCWHFGPKPRKAEFWFRRQAHETAMHVRDAEQAVGEPTPVDPALVLDGIDEILTMFVPRQVRLGRLDAGPGAVELRPDDVRATPFRLAPGGDGETLGAVTGPAETLLLLLWRRLPPDAPGIRITGDERGVRSILALPLTP